MAEINVEKKKPMWHWVIAAIIAALVIWALIEMLDSNDRNDAMGTTTTEQPAATMPAAGPDTNTTAANDGLDRYAGVFGSGSMQLDLNANGNYTMDESPAGQGQGTWMHDSGQNALHLTPNDGTPDRFFRVDGTDALTPLDANGQPAAQMTQLQRRVAQ